MTTMLLALAACASQAPQFDFVHVSDTHVEARAAGSEAPTTIRGAETFD